jgi:hypothetical protein
LEIAAVAGSAVPAALRSSKQNNEVNRFISRVISGFLVSPFRFVIGIEDAIGV